MISKSLHMPSGRSKGDPAPHTECGAAARTPRCEPHRLEGWGGQVAVWGWERLGLTLAKPFNTTRVRHKYFSMTNATFHNSTLTMNASFIVVQLN